MSFVEKTLSRREASDAVSEHGGRFILGAFKTSVPVGSFAEAVAAATRIAAACGPDGDDRLRLDVRADQVLVTLQSLTHPTTTDVDVRLAREIAALGLPLAPETVQILEV